MKKDYILYLQYILRIYHRYVYNAIVDIMQYLWTRVGTHFLHTAINQQPP